jgi:hypothetical protein
MVLYPARDYMDFKMELLKSKIDDVNINRQALTQRSSQLMA